MVILSLLCESWVLCVARTRLARLTKGKKECLADGYRGGTTFAIIGCRYEDYLRLTYERKIQTTRLLTGKSHGTSESDYKSPNGMRCCAYLMNDGKLYFSTIRIMKQAQQSSTEAQSINKSKQYSINTLPQTYTTDPPQDMLELLGTFWLARHLRSKITHPISHDGKDVG